MKNKNFFQFENLKGQSNLIHGIFDKNFGNVSLLYGSKKKVETNKKKIARTLGIDWQNICSVKEVHGSKVKKLGNLEIKKLRRKKVDIIGEADGLITDLGNVFLMIKTADCFPVLFFDPVSKAVGAVHVGWRGAIEKIFLTALLKMINVFNSKAKDILVGIGPGIQACCFKHKNLIQEKLPEWGEYIKDKKNGWKSVNMTSFIKDQLIEAGVKKNNIESAKICTCCSKEYFSHLRSLQTGGLQGRFATIIGLS